MPTEGRNWSIQKAGCWQELDKTICRGFVVAAGKSSDEKKMLSLIGFPLRKAGLETSKKKGGGGQLGRLVLPNCKGSVSSQRGVLSRAEVCIIGCIKQAEIKHDGLVSLDSTPPNGPDGREREAKAVIYAPSPLSQSDKRHKLHGFGKETPRLNPFSLGCTRKMLQSLLVLPRVREGKVKRGSPGSARRQPRPSGLVRVLSQEWRDSSDGT